MRILLFLPIFFCWTSLAQLQDLSQNYQPLKSKAPLPPLFTLNIRQVIAQDLNELKGKKEKDEALKSTFLTASNYEIDRILRSGNALVNDEVTNYLNKVVDVVLKDNEILRNKIQIYTLKSPVVNAYSYDKGYIFMNIGLIAQLESEAQLAYIICHEISHFTKQHHINGFVLNDHIDRTRYDGGKEEKQIEKCQYSKEYESEADLEGFKLFERSAYDLKQAEKGFAVLQYSHLPFELLEINKTFFESKDYTLPANYFLSNFNPIKDNSNEDDSKMTHPNTKKRRQAVATLVSERDNTGRKTAVISDSTFIYIRDLCRMELCRLYLKNRDYPNALYASYILLQSYPENQFALETLSKAMYGIGLYMREELQYNKASSLPDGIPSFEKVESYPEELYYLIEKMTPHEWTVMSLNKVYRFHKKYPENATLKGMSDSLFNLLGRTEWPEVNFSRKRKSIAISTVDSTAAGKPSKSKTELIASLQEETNSAHGDTLYFKDVFIDLFLEDPEFVKKFPDPNYTSNGGKSFSISGRTYNNKRVQEEYHNFVLENGLVIDTVILLQPFYYQIDQRNKQSLKYISSDKKQEDYVNTLDYCANKEDLTLVKLDPELLGEQDADRMNDLSVVNDWFEERFDSDVKNGVILNTDEIDKVIAKYGSPYVLHTGIAAVIDEAGRKRSYFYGYLFDLQKNKLVYRRLESFHRLDRVDLMHAKTYQLIYDLKHPKTEE